MRKRRTRSAAKNTSRPEATGSRRLGLWRQWSELGLEKKLSIVVIPVLLTLVSVFLPRLLDGDSSASAEGKEKLQVVGKPIVKNGPTKGNHIGIDGEIQFLVRNTGSVSALISEIEFRVARLERGEVCVSPEGELPVSGSYDLLLSDADTVGKSLRVNSSQEVPAGQADRFAVKVRAANDRGSVGGVSRLYLFDIFLHHSNAKEPLKAGEALVAVPFPEAYQFTFSGLSLLSHLMPDPECPARNMRRLKAILTEPAARSAELDRFASAPSEVTPSVASIPEPRFPAPSAADRSKATQAASKVVASINQGDFAAACSGFDERAAGLIAFWSGKQCARYVESVVGGSAGKLKPPTVASFQPGWIKLLTGNGVRRLALIAELLPVGVLNPADPLANTAWSVTNLYDQASGPLKLDRFGQAGRQQRVAGD